MPSRKTRKKSKSFRRCPYEEGTESAIEQNIEKLILLKFQTLSL